MKLPSLDHLRRATLATARRFPAATACALAAATFASIGVDTAGQEDWFRAMGTAALGLPLFAGLTLLSERRGLGPLVWVLRIVGFGLLGLFLWRWSTWGDPSAMIRYFHLSATLHLAVAVCAYVGRPEPKGFWQFNRSLFERFLIAGVYSAVLFAGLALALAGIDNLLGFDIDNLNYARLFFFMAFGFQTVFFLAGVPRDLEALDRRDDYPTGLRVFSQYVLVPLVSVYLIILTIYLGRVLITTTWPSGWIGYLVSALAAVGILSLLLVHPERGRGEHGWIERYARTFWVAILPAVAMLLMAVAQRIGQYGITERRYLLAVLALWLAATALYYAITRSQRIIGIPLSLAAIGLVTWIGPWSAYSVSHGSQLGRLEGLLESHGALADGRLTGSSPEVPQGDWEQVRDVLTYLIEYHGTVSIDSWFEGGVATVDSIAEGTEPSYRFQAGQRAALLMDHIGVTPEGGLPLGPGGFTYVTPEGGVAGAIDVRGFDFVLTNVSLGGGTHAVGDDTFAFTIDGLDVVVTSSDTEVARISVEPVIQRAEATPGSWNSGQVELPPDALRLDAGGDGWAVRLHLFGLSLQRQDGDVQLGGGSATALIRTEEPTDP